MRVWLPMVMILAGGAAFPAQAADIRPLLKAGLDGGGDTIEHAVLSNGDRRRIHANDGLYFGAGLAISDDASNVELHLSLAVKGAASNADNGDVRFTRWPAEALVFYRFTHLRLGGGLAAHLAPRLEGNGAASNIDVTFKPALGAVLQADWLFGPKIGLGLRYTMIEYDAKAPASGSAKANGGGIAFSVSF